jgi:hypothetical protein
VKWVDFPEEVTEGILVESGNILESSPFLGHISWLSCGSDKLSKITISLLSESSIENF